MPKANTEETPKKGPDSVSYWLQWLKSSQDAAKRHIDETKDAWREYLNIQEDMDSGSTLKRRTPPKKYPIFWSTIKTLQPAYYSRTPIPATRQMFDADDPDARTACLLGDRLATYLMQCSPYDTVMASARDDFILSDKATVRVFFEAKIESNPEKEYVEELPDGSGWIDGDGEPVTAPIQTDEDGLYYVESNQEYLESARTYLLPVDFDEVLHTPYARHWDEVQEIAFKCTMSKPDFTDRFGAAKAAKAAFAKREEEDKDLNKAPGLFIDIWEIWDKRSKRVLWVSEKYRGDFLDVQDDPYELRGFFPCAPFIIGTKPAKSMYPTTLYSQVKPFISQLHSLFNRLFKLISAVRRRGLADAQFDELIQAINSAADVEIVGVQGFAAIMEKGGLQNLLQYVPVKELYECIIEMGQIEERFKNAFFEFTGVPDIVRGSSDPIETAAAQQTKGTFAALRFSYNQKQIQELARNGLELMVDLALKKLDDSSIAEIMGFRYLDPEDQQRFPSALALLRDDSSRMIRIDIETDSTSYLNDQMNQANQAKISDAIMQGLQTIGGLSQNMPEAVPVAIKLLTSQLRGMTLGKQFTDEVDQAVKDLMDKVNNPPEPGPDYEQMAFQLKQQDLALRERMQGFKEWEGQMKVQYEDRSQSLAEWQAQSESRFKDIEMMLNERVVQFEQFMSERVQQLEEYKVQLDEKEKYMTEDRLQSEAALKEREMLLTEYVQASAQQQASPQPVINVTVAAPPPKPTQKQVIRSMTPAGEPVWVVSDIPEPPQVTLTPPVIE